MYIILPCASTCAWWGPLWGARSAAAAAARTLPAPTRSLRGASRPPSGPPALGNTLRFRNRISAPKRPMRAAWRVRCQRSLWRDHRAPIARPTGDQCRPLRRASSGVLRVAKADNGRSSCAGSCSRRHTSQRARSNGLRASDRYPLSYAGRMEDITMFNNCKLDEDKTALDS